MKSLGTNILLDAADEDCREHEAAIRLVNDALREPAEWMLSDQVLFELDAGLRHPGIFAKPLSAAKPLDAWPFSAMSRGSHSVAMS